jgi:hypothetical protein
VTVGVRRPGEKRRREQVALLEEVSASGARLVTDHPLPPGTPLEYEVPGTDIRGHGRVVFARVFETPVGTRFALGVQREAGKAPGARTRNRMAQGTRHEAAHAAVA